MTNKLEFRYFIILSYKGTHYNGWQVQPNGITVQGVLNERLTLILGEEINLTGAGRTDSGVHASGFVAHFDSSHPGLEQDQAFIRKINNFLPDDIAVHSLFPVTPEAHARFDATRRTYKYRILTEKDPFKNEFCWLLQYPLDVNVMNQAAEMLFCYTDFTSFSKLHTDVKTNNCIITNASWKQTKNELIFTISANRFLRNMVRAIVSTLVDTGRKKIEIKDFKNIIESHDRGQASASAPAKGLHLVSIEYPETIFPPGQYQTTIYGD